jgi:hypothetical protein
MKEKQWEEVGIGNVISVQEGDVGGISSIEGVLLFITLSMGFKLGQERVLDLLVTVLILKGGGTESSYGA